MRYVKEFDVPPIGRGVFVRTRQQNDDRQAKLQETSDVVPATQLRVGQAKGA